MKLHLDAKELTGQGQVKYLEALTATAQFVMLFNGNGSFSVQSGGTIAGLNATASVSGSYTPGFKRVKLQAALTMDISLELMDLTVALDIQADTGGNPKVVVKAQALGLPPVTLPMDSLSGLTLKALQDALNQVQKQFLNQLGKLFSDAAKNGEALANRWGQVLASSVSDFAKKNHLDKVQTGVPVIDNALGQVSQGLKTGGSDLAHGVQNASSGVSNWYHSTFGVGYRSLSLTDDGISELSRLTTAQTRQLQLETRLAPLLSDLRGVAILRTTLGTQGRASASELRLRIRNCAAAPEGQDGAVVAFSVEVSGYQHGLDPHNVRPPQVTSDLKPGRIHFRGMFGKGRPVAKIDMPALQHGSAFPADDLLWTAVSAILTRRMPNAIEQGRQTERLLAVQNATGERLTVYAQTLLPNGTLLPGPDFEPYSVPPDGKTHLLDLSNKAPLHGVAARIWAKGAASGRVWDKNKIPQIWLVEESEGNQGRHYYAPAPETFIYRFASSKEGAAKAKAAIDKARLNDIRKKAELLRQKAIQEAAARQKAQEELARRLKEQEQLKVAANLKRIRKKAEEARLTEQANAERIRKRAEVAALKGGGRGEGQR